PRIEPGTDPRWRHGSNPVWTTQVREHSVSHEGKWPGIGPAAHAGPSRLISRRVIIPPPTPTIKDSDSRLALRVPSKATPWEVSEVYDLRERIDALKTVMGGVGSA